MGREDKALIAARLDSHIEKELLDRLKKGTYGDIYNFSQKAFEKALANEEMEEEEEDEEEIDKEVEEELEAEYESEEEDRVFVKDFGEDDHDSSEVVSSEEDDSPAVKTKPVTKGKRKSLKARLEIEYETEAEPRQKVVSK